MSLLSIKRHSCLQKSPPSRKSHFCFLGNLKLRKTHQFYLKSLLSAKPGFFHYEIWCRKFLFQCKVPNKLVGCEMVFSCQVTTFRPLRLFFSHTTQRNLFLGCISMASIWIFRTDLQQSGIYLLKFYCNIWFWEKDTFSSKFCWKGQFCLKKKKRKLLSSDFFVF